MAINDIKVPQIKCLLIVANSGRMLAHYANKTGIKSLVIDCYADMDMQISVLAWQKVQSLALKNVEPAFIKLNKLYKISHVIYGSGLEQHQNTLKFLCKNASVIGNSFDVFSTIQNKAYFFSKLTGLNCPFPETSFQPPNENDGWLIKPIQGEGGIGIKKYSGLTQETAFHYWQKHIAGIPLSVLFFANELDYEIIGFHKQFFQRLDESDFAFSGVINYFEIKENIKQHVNQILTGLVSCFVLKGINSLDFILKNDQIYILEINPRPSASMQVYNQDLLSDHIESCLCGQLNKQSELQISQAPIYQSYHLIYADTDLIIKENIQWPDWVTDRPEKGIIIYTSMPICSIIASGKNEQQVLELLETRKKILLDTLGDTINPSRH